MQTDEVNFLQFLTEEYQRGLSFSYLCGYISTVNSSLPSHILDANIVKKINQRLF